MRAVALTRYLPIDDPESLVDVELADPRPDGHDLLVRVEAISVNPVDTKVRSPKPQVEADLRAVPQGTHASADARDKPLAGQCRQIAANRDFRNRKRLRKFRNLHGIPRFEEPQHMLHPFLLR